MLLNGAIIGQRPKKKPNVHLVSSQRSVKQLTVLVKLLKKADKKLLYTVWMERFEKRTVTGMITVLLLAKEALFLLPRK